MRVIHDCDQPAKASATFWAVAFALALILIPVEASAGVATPSSTCHRSASFNRLPHGWEQQSLGCAQHEGGSLSAWSGATSWRYRPDPHGPIDQMRRNRVLISVILLRPKGFPASSPRAFRPLRKHSLRLGAADQIATEEGAPTIPQYRFFRRVGCQYDLDLRVDFGRPHPTRTMKRQAQRALNALVLPRWIARC
jgi:hypothetical protein